jgi:hypothetical protein
LAGVHDTHAQNRRDNYSPNPGGARRRRPITARNPPPRPHDQQQPTPPPSPLPYRATQQQPTPPPDWWQQAADMEQRMREMMEMMTRILNGQRR